MLLVKNLTKSYNNTPALRNVSLEVATGAVFGLLGPNGAGKSTLLKLVMGFILPNSGQIQCQTQPQHIGYLPERPSFPETARVDDYLRTAASLAGIRGRAQLDGVAAVLHTVGLSDIAGRRIRTCSKGMRQRLAVAQALIGNPDLLLLDEPAAGLDPAGQVQMRNLILSLQQAGKTVVLSTHQLSEVTQLCSHVAILSGGRLTRIGTLNSVLLAEPHVQIKVDAPALETSHADLLSALRSLAPNLAVEGNQITLVGAAIEHKTAILRQLLDAGLDVQGLVQQQANLEEIYLEAIRP